MRRVKYAVEIRIDRLAAPGQLDERGFLTAITLISLEARDPVAEPPSFQRTTVVTRSFIAGWSNVCRVCAEPGTTHPAAWSFDQTCAETC